MSMPVDPFLNAVNAATPPAPTDPGLRIESLRDGGYIVGNSSAILFAASGIDSAMAYIARHFVPKPVAKNPEDLIEAKPGGVIGGYTKDELKNHFDAVKARLEAKAEEARKAAEAERMRLLKGELINRLDGARNPWA